MRVPVTVTALLLSLLPAHAEEPSLPAPAELQRLFTEGVEVLNKLYWSPTLSIWLDREGDDIRAHYEGRLNPPWWPSANAVEALIDYMNATGSNEYDATITALYELHRAQGQKGPRIIAELKRRNQWSEADERKHAARVTKAEEAAQKPKPAEPDPHADYYTEFRNEYLDDTGWWGITWLKMHARTQREDYLKTARAVHAHMARNWRPDKGGGIMWCEEPDKVRPNAITNNLFLILSARLYETTQESAYLDWAKKTHDWLIAEKLFDGRAVVDGPGHKDDYWTYNQGTYLGGLMEMVHATHEVRYLEEAVQAANAMLDFDGIVRPDGVLYERIGTGGDAALFKGIFLRYLAQMSFALRVQKLYPETAQKIDRCIRNSVDSLLKHSRKEDGRYTVEWYADAKDQKADFNTQVSALCAFAAALRR